MQRDACGPRALLAVPSCHGPRIHLHSVLVRLYAGVYAARFTRRACRSTVLQPLAAAGAPAVATVYIQFNSPQVAEGNLLTWNNMQPADVLPCFLWVCPVGCHG